MFPVCHENVTKYQLLGKKTAVDIWTHFVFDITEKKML